MNAGQTCVACDFVFVHDSVVESFLDELKCWITKFFGENPKESKDYSRIVNDFHTSRLEEMI